MARIVTQTKSQGMLGGLSPDFASRLQRLIAASGGKVWLVSGYRSPERQAQLFSAAVKKYGSEKAARKWVAPPGKSNHNHGIAADLGGDLKLAAKLAPQFGLHFPMSWEPWHIEPVDHKSDPDAHTAPPDDFQAADPFTQNINTLASMFGMPGAEQATATTGSVGGDAIEGIDEFMARLAGIESGGNYGSVNRDSGAAGKYQIMPYNWPSWSAEAGLGRNAPRTPENQEKVARFKMQQYYSQFGSWEAVAAAWYGGPKAAQIYLKNPSDPYLTRKQGKYPSIAEYIARAA